MWTRTNTTRWFIKLDKSPAFVRQLQIDVREIIVGVIEEERGQLEEGGRLEEEEATNGPDVGDIAVVIPSSPFEDISDPDEPWSTHAGGKEDAVELKEVISRFVERSLKNTQLCGTILECATSIGSHH